MVVSLSMCVCVHVKWVSEWECEWVMCVWCVWVRDLRVREVTGMEWSDVKWSEEITWQKKGGFSLEWPVGSIQGTERTKTGEKRSCQFSGDSDQKQGYANQPLSRSEGSQQQQPQKKPPVWWGSIQCAGEEWHELINSVFWRGVLVGVGCGEGSCPRCPLPWPHVPVAAAQPMLIGSQEPVVSAMKCMPCARHSSTVFK